MTQQKRTTPVTAMMAMLGGKSASAGQIAPQAQMQAQAPQQPQHQLPPMTGEQVYRVLTGNGRCLPG